MSKHEKKTSSLLHYPVLVVFSLFFIGTAVTASWKIPPSASARR